ncbi:MAG: formate dehydrogenase subunit delta [Rhizobiaceae bacterium]|nr:formate dehydrogenase subunit delta [Rhizobiaceae bacterium]
MSHEAGTAMNTDQKLVYMANQIASFFKSMPEDEAQAGVAKHINDFWDPRMRRRLHRIVEAGGDGLSPLVLSAADEIRWPEPTS